jgi:glycine/D-amino acid oxidase-like deaminating enzyme
MRVSVVGAGVFGAWSAKCLADRGHQVTLLDAYGPANGRASSADHSRVIRAGYGADEIYSRWAQESLREWQLLAAATGQSLLARTGALFLGEPGNPYVRDTFETLSRLGISVELLDAVTVNRRFPPIRGDGLGDCVYEVQAGVIRARAAVQSLVAHVMANRAVSYEVMRVTPVDEQRDHLVVATTAGSQLTADAFVFACGPWLPAMFPIAVGGRIRATRQEVLYFGVPAGDPQYSASRLPVWIDFMAGLYGIPDLDAHGFKVGVDRHGPVIDPDSLERTLDAEVASATRRTMGHRFPGLANAPLLDAHVCQYENTSTGDFLIDRHPSWPTCWIVGGGSGHGFKHGPAVGRYVADLVEGRAVVQSRFALAGKTTVAARAVY